MISAEKIGELVKNPLLTKGVSASEILEIRTKFPYCSTLHLLYLKRLALDNDVQFEDHLRFAAAHVMDRERMYHVIHSDSEVTSGVEDTETSSAGQIEEEVKGAETSSAGQIEEGVRDAEINSVQQVEEGVKGAEINSVQQVEENVEEPGLTAEKSDDLIAETILPNLVDTAYTHQLDQLSKVTEPAAAAEPVKTTGTQEIVPVDLSGLSFVEWLKYKQGQPVESKSAEPVKKEEEPQAVEPVTGTPASEQPKRKALSKTAIDALLNKFIEEEPSISKPKTEFYSPAKTAKQSLEEQNDLVTETLAKIYVLQKNYAKAIKAYEQLILVYPEKKTFFASQIKKLQEEQH